MWPDKVSGCVVRMTMYHPMRQVPRERKRDDVTMKVWHGETITRFFNRKVHTTCTMHGILRPRIGRISKHFSVTVLVCTFLWKDMRDNLRSIENCLWASTHRPGVPNSCQHKSSTCYAWRITGLSITKNPLSQAILDSPIRYLHSKLPRLSGDILGLSYGGVVKAVDCYWLLRTIELVTDAVETNGVVPAVYS